MRGLWILTYLWAILGIDFASFDECNGFKGWYSIATPLCQKVAVGLDGTSVRMARLRFSVFL